MPCHDESVYRSTRECICWRVLVEGSKVLLRIWAYFVSTGEVQVVCPGANVGKPTQALTEQQEAIWSFTEADHVRELCNLYRTKSASKNSAHGLFVAPIKYMCDFDINGLRKLNLENTFCARDCCQDAWPSCIGSTLWQQFVQVYTFVEVDPILFHARHVQGSTDIPESVNILEILFAIAQFNTSTR